MRQSVIELHLGTAALQPQQLEQPSHALAIVHRIPAAAERVYHAGQLKYHSAGAAKRSAGPGVSADELCDTY